MPKSSALLKIVWRSIPKLLKVIKTAISVNAKIKHRRKFDYYHLLRNSQTGALVSRRYILLQT